MTATTMNTKQAAEKVGIPAKQLLESLKADSLIERTPNRHYKANPALIRAGMATSGDLQWTRQGLTFLKKAYKPIQA